MVKGGKMGKVILFDSSQNSAKNFEILRANLSEVANNRNMSMVEVIDGFILDLKNYFNEDYNSVTDIDLEGDVSIEVIKKCIEYMNKMKKAYQKSEKRHNRQQKRSDKKEIKKNMKEKWEQLEETINGDIMDPNVREKVMSGIKGNSNLSKEEKDFMVSNFNEEIQKFNEMWNDIQNIVEEQINSKQATKLECWKTVRKLIENKNVDEKMKTQITSLIDKKIAEEKDNIYFEETKRFTDNFKFLKGYPEVYYASVGKKEKRFTDREAFDRFFELRALLQKGSNEYSEISKLLGNKEISEGDKRILTARIEVMDKEASKMPEAR